MKITKGTLAAADFTFAFAADNREQLQQLTLAAADAFAAASTGATGLQSGFFLRAIIV